MEMYIDDIVAWDGNGAINNDFLGVTSVFTVFPDADTAQSDWVRNTGSNDYEMINDPAPDDDVTYLTAGSAGDRSEFGIADLPAEVGTISGVYIPSRARLDEPGSGEMRVSMLSGVAVADGASKPVSTSYAYSGDVFETDPNTGSAWTRASFNASQLRIEKTV